MDLIITIILLMATYFTGRWVEFRQFRSLEARERSDTQITVLNLEEDPNLPQATHTELVTAHISLSADYFRRYLGDIISLFGGSLHTLESLSDRARREIIQRLQIHAPKASYITGTRIEVMKERSGVVEMLAIATAVYHDHPLPYPTFGHMRGLDHACNAPRKHPLKEFAFYGSITLLLLFAIMSGGGYIIDPIAKHIPVSAENWLWDHLGHDMEPDTGSLSPELKKYEQKLQKLLDSLPKDPAIANQKFTLTLVDDPSANAISLPGQRIIVFTGLLDDLGSENALVFILGHELGHFANRDHAKQLVKLLLNEMVSWVLGDADFSSVTSTMGLHFSREQEKAADLVGLDALVHHYGHAGGATDFFATRTHRSQQGWRGAFGKVGDFFSSHPDDQERLDYLVTKIQHKSYKVGKVKELNWANIEPENLSVDQLVQKYPYEKLKRLDSQLAAKYFYLYERFWDIWVDGTLYQEHFTDVWITNAETAKKRNRQSLPYNLAAWKSYVKFHMNIKGDIPEPIRTKLETMLSFRRAQAAAEIEVLKAHKAALNLLVAHGNIWHPLSKDTIKMGYKGGGAEFQEYNKKILAANKKRYDIWHERDDAENALLEALDAWDDAQPKLSK